MSHSKQDIERLVTHCVTHLQDHAAHYLSLIQSKRVGGVLWAVFRVGERILPESAQQGVELHKASFLALSSMVSSKADVLLRMQRDCDQDRQFVCWFTLDDPKGGALASKVLTIDAGSSTEEDEYRRGDVGTDSVLSTFRQRSERHSERHHDMHGDSAGASLVSSVRPASAENREGAPKQLALSRNPPPPEASTTGPPPPRTNSPRTVRDLLAAVAQSHRPSTPPPHQHVTTAPQRPSPPPQNSEDAQASGATVAMLMRMVMQVADSVASMGAAMDHITSRCGVMESEIKTLKERVHQVEVPMFGDDYSFATAVAASGGPRVGSESVDGGRRHPHVAWSSNEADGAGSQQGGKKRALLSASEMLIQLTELSLRLGETENRVRVLESNKDSAEMHRKILHEQLEGVKTRMVDIAKVVRVQENSLLNSSNGGVGNGRPTEFNRPVANDYPWRNQQQQDHQTGGNDRSHYVDNSQSEEMQSQQYRKSASASSSSIAAATRMMDSPFKGYTPPLSHHRPSSTGASSPPRSNPSSEPQSTLPVEHATQRPPPGPLSDMIRSLESKLGGIRSAR